MSRLLPCLAVIWLALAVGLAVNGRPLTGLWVAWVALVLLVAEVTFRGLS